MNVRAWTLPSTASSLDKATLRLMKVWHGGLREAVRAFWFVAVVLGAATAGVGLVWVGTGALEAVAGIAVVLAFPLGWAAHRRRYPVHVPRRLGPAVVGGLLGVVGSVLLRAPVTALLFVLDYGAPTPWRVVIRLLVASAIMAAGWWTAQRRYRNIAS